MVRYLRFARLLALVPGGELGPIGVIAIPLALATAGCSSSSERPPPGDVCTPSPCGVTADTGEPPFDVAPEASSDTAGVRQIDAADANAAEVDADADAGDGGDGGPGWPPSLPFFAV